MKSYDRLKDELLVIQVQTGDTAAFDELIGRWQERLWRYAHSLTDDADSAWDAVQETWVSVVNGIKRLEDPEAFPAWAYRILSNKCADLIRSRRRQRRFAEEAAEAPSSRSETAHSLNDALTRLPGEMRALLSLYYTDEYSVREIAGILGIPEGTVKSRLHAARERLRELMER